MRRRWSIALLAMTLSTTLAIPAAAHEPPTFRVTITNLTPNELMTPFVVATHRGHGRVFHRGRHASFGLGQLAENGAVPVLVEELSGRRGVAAVAVAGAGPVAPGSSISVDITTRRGANRLSVVGMIICSNDGFAGVDGVRLPRHVGQTVSVAGIAYDAGTEINTEAYADLVPPCDGRGQSGVSNPALAEHGVVRVHGGITGIGDLDPELHHWTNPVIRVSIERTG